MTGPTQNAPVPDDRPPQVGTGLAPFHNIWGQSARLSASRNACRVFDFNSRQMESAGNSLNIVAPIKVETETGGPTRIFAILGE